jgi:hypothetical protein
VVLVDVVMESQHAGLELVSISDWLSGRDRLAQPDQFRIRRGQQGYLRSVVDNAGILLKQLFGLLIQIRCNLVDLVFLLTFSAFQAYPTALPVYFQFTITFFALHRGTLRLLNL